VDEGPRTEKGRIGAAMRHVRSEADGACWTRIFIFTAGTPL
jgi:hypothetical protein